ncbi:hypothetical protein BGZ46_003246 [Entomortierella lignicola]|nr:hypothetical protein BGZ46_003246 [Entomortierella lignicola]
MSNDLHHDKRPSPGQRSSSPPPTLHSNISFTTHDSSSNLYPHDLAIDAARDLHMEDSPPSSGGNIRWAMLAAACLVMFGNYYAFDNPAALNKPLQDYMEMSDDTYAYFLNILYTSYSLPNIVLPWLGGFASDKFGHRRLLIFLSAMVAFGHFIVCLGVQRRSVPAMILGRVFFGAGESLAVTQSAITVKYFRGKELAMALGINLW